jgi:mRNA guanylyltransferase
MKPADCSVVSLPLPDRLRLLHSYVLEPRHQFQQAQHLKHLFNNELKQNSIHTPNGRGFDIKPKNMYRAEDTKYVLEVVLPHLPHEQDGLIYTAVNRRYTIGTDHSLIKWKPPYLNSVDFILESIVGANHQKYYYLMVGERNVERHTYEQTRVDWVTVSDKDRSEFNINGRVVVEAVWAKELETIVMKKNEDSGSSKWVPGHTRIGGWKIIRTRPDKKSSNDIRVYKKIKESIRDNVLEHDLIEALGDDGENATGLEPGAKKQRR